jgi:putative membrane protein
VGALARIGPFGFLLFCLWFVGVFLLLGAAWLSAAPGEQLDCWWLFTWARMVREAASDLLPFSQIGGVALGARTLAAHGVESRRANAAILVDLTTEMAAQLVFTALGIALFLMTVSTSAETTSLRSVILLGTATLLAIMIAFFAAHRFGLGYAGRIAERLFPGADLAATAIGEELRATYSSSRALGASFFFNLLAWVASAAGAWICLTLMGVHVRLWPVLMVESLIFTLRSVAFVIPGALGVQELGYLALAPLIGITPQAILALSLAKRARDLIIGLPTLVVWQFGEMRALTARSAESFRTGDGRMSDDD